MRRYLLLIVGSLISVVLDQASKVWAVGALSLKPEGALPADAYDIVTRVMVISESWWNFKLAGNKGAAWGLFRNLPESMRVPFFVLISLVAVGVIVTLYRKAHGQRLLQWALTLILGGAIGNLIDRVRIGYVVDFIDWHYGVKHWPTFNVADIGITVGVVLLLLDMLQQRKAEAEAADDPARAGD
jgi:signal peptidase II